MPRPARKPANRARWLLLGASAGAIATAIAGCSARTRYNAPTTPMPPDTVLLSSMMQQLSAHPGFTETVLSEINKGGKNGPALLTPKLATTLRKLILGKDWQGLNRFPGWTMREINPTVAVVSRVAGKDTKVEGLANPGKGASASPSSNPPASPQAPAQLPVGQWLDLGNLPSDQPATVDLDQPSQLPGFAQEASQQGSVTELGAGVTRGDGPDPALAPMHPESARLAYLLNRLSLNGRPGVPEAAATLGGQRATTPSQLVELLTAQHHTVTVNDARYFANFGHFHFRPGGTSGGPSQDVMMPFWVNSRILVPGTRRPLLVPVSHAEYEWSIRGPRVNADVAFYFGIDGKAEFRTMDELNQPWVLGRHAHTYTGPQALEVTRLTASFVRTYIDAHRAHPNLPFGGYYALGVCQDAVAAIEKKLTGHATLFPNTADTALFNDPAHAEINALIAAIPKDRDGARPTPERIFGSLPTTDLQAITIPGLSADLLSTQEAWRSGDLDHVHGRHYWVTLGLEVLGIALAAFTVYRLRRRSTPKS